MKRSLYKLRVPNNVAELVQGLHPQLKRKVRAAVEQVLADTRSGKALKDKLVGLWSFRVGRFRVIYRIASGRAIELVAIGPRDCIYESTFRLITKLTRT